CSSCSIGKSRPWPRPPRASRSRRSEDRLVAPWPAAGRPRPPRPGARARRRAAGHPRGAWHPARGEGSEAHRGKRAAARSPPERPGPEVRSEEPPHPQRHLSTVVAAVLLAALLEALALEHRLGADVRVGNGEPDLADIEGAPGLATGLDGALEQES